MTDDTTRHQMEAMPRPRGSGYQGYDNPLIDEMRAHRLAGKSWHRAAWLVVDRAHGAGSKEARVKRLVALAKSIHGELSPERLINSIIHPSGAGGESGSVAPMTTAPATAANQTDLAALRARVAELEADRRALFGLVDSQQDLLVRQRDLLAEQERRRRELDGKVDEAERRAERIEATIRNEVGVGATRH